MKRPVIFISIILIGIGIAAGVFFFRSGAEPEQEFRANLTEAQKMLVTLRRAEAVYQQTENGFKYVSAKRSGGKMIYSEGWRTMNLPEVETGTGFDYECLPAEGACQATEAGKTGLSGNGIRIDIETGVYSCSGAYKPVSTEGFDGTPVVVACQAA